MTMVPNLNRDLPLAILGAGPIGLEAALAASRRGLPFILFEAGDEVAAHVADWGHVRLFTPWSLSVSPRMRAHLAAEGIAVSDDTEDCPTGDELRQQVLVPIAESQAIAPHLRLGTRVSSVARQGLLKHQEIASPERASRPFRLLTVDGGGQESVTLAGAVIDCTGSWSNPNWVGDGGIPAPGERDLGDHIERRIPDFEADGSRWVGRRILLVGSGHSAQTAARDLAAFAASHPDTRVTWVLRSEQPSFDSTGPDPLPVRQALTTYASHLVAGGSSSISVLPGVVVEAFGRLPRAIQVSLRRADDSLELIEIDRVLALTGAVGDSSLYRQLQIHECYATSGPMQLAATLLGASGEATDCLDQTSHGVDTLRSPEPHFYILGVKSYGRNGAFLLRVGWSQVDEVMAALAP